MNIDEIYFWIAVFFVVVGVLIEIFSSSIGRFIAIIGLLIALYEVFVKRIFG
jgi:hypothetical protein